jgi:hypothetical protein
MTSVKMKTPKYLSCIFRTENSERQALKGGNIACRTSGVRVHSFKNVERKSEKQRKENKKLFFLSNIHRKDIFLSMCHLKSLKTVPIKSHHL